MKGPMKLTQQVKVAHSFLHVTSKLSFYHFKLVRRFYILLPKKVPKPATRSREEDRFYKESFLASLENQLQHTPDFSPKVLNGTFFV